MKASVLRSLGVSLLGFIWVAPVAADGHEVGAYSKVLETCLDGAVSTQGRAACKGTMSSVCMETEGGGYSTYGMVRCSAAETQVWDRLLNAAYQAQMAGLKEMDAAEAVDFPEFAKRADALRDAQRAWIAFRDAECGLAFAMWGSGSMRRIAAAGCHAEMTADRAIELQSLGEDMR